MRKGFLSDADNERPTHSAGLTKRDRRKKHAPPDDAFLPLQSLALLDDDDKDEDDNPSAKTLVDLDAVDSADAAHEYSKTYAMTHLSAFTQLELKLDPMVNVAFANDLSAVRFNRRMWGHHDGSGLGAEKCSMLLPSGIVLNYLEWGNENAPPIILLHDLNDSCHAWDDVSPLLARRYRVLALDLRGHGETSRSPRREYGIEHLVTDLHELVVRLSLNGREWGGAYTRPWVLCGKGMGGAVAVAYAAAHEGRVAGLVLWDYDPEMRKDRLCFSPYQAALFTGQEQVAALLARDMGLRDDAKYLAINFVNRAEHVDEADEKAGARFRMDPHFFLADHSPGLAWTQLRAVAPGCAVLILHNQSSVDWTYERALAVHDALARGGEAGAPSSLALAVVSRGTVRDDDGNLVEDIAKLFGGVAKHVLEFADGIDRAARARLKASGGVRYQPVSAVELEAKATEREAIRQAAREAAGFMRKDDPPPPSFESFDD